MNPILTTKIKTFFWARMIIFPCSTFNFWVSVVQAENGDVFLFDYDNGLDGKAIQSVTLTECYGSHYAGIDTLDTFENVTIVCFVSGTRILTAGGELPVENLRPGMQVVTLDHGLQEIRWTHETFSPQAGDHAPISFAPGCLGPGLPRRPLRVSPQHRILLGSKIVKQIFGVSQVLAPAKHLRSLLGVSQSWGGVPIKYHHFACAQHEVVFAEAAPVETFYPGPQARASLSDTSLAELERRIPALRNTPYPEPARPFAGRGKIEQMIARHRKNVRALQDAAELALNT